MQFDSPPISKPKPRSPSRFSCCFGSAGYHEEGDRPATAIRSSAVWLRLKAQELPEIGGRCRDAVARVGRHGHRRRHSVGELVYDPLSYALNFDEGDDDDDEVSGNLFRYRNFSSRLPPSPATTGR